MTHSFPTRRVSELLIDQGHWISAKRGEVLIRENQAAPSLFYLAEGRALIQRDGADVGTLADGALIGEATVLDGSHATGTVILTSNARLRSEEHTSELQSLMRISYAVFCLKKKN